MTERRQTSARLRVLVTGFGPFPGVAVNASSQLVAAIRETAPEQLPDVAILCEILPTEWQRGIAELDALWDRFTPDIALHFGVADRANGFEIERIAVNTCIETADACGAFPYAPHIHAHGPAYIETLLPLDAITTALSQNGISNCISDDAGRYLCNAVFYSSVMRARAAAGGALAGFVHIPQALAPAMPGTSMSARAQDCPIDWNGAIRGAHIVIETAFVHLSAIRNGRDAPVG